MVRENNIVLHADHGTAVPKHQFVDFELEW